MKSTTTTWRKSLRLVMIALVLAMVATACGTSSDDTTTTTAGEGGGTATTTTAGSGGGGGETGDEVTGTLTVVVPTEHQTLDPQHHRNRMTQIISRKVHDNLVYLDPTQSETTYVWKLATGYEMVDELTWDIFLREGVTFHDGYPFNSESVVYTYGRLLDPELNSPRASMQSQSQITEVEAIDDYTVRFHLSEPIELHSQGFPIRLGIYSQEMLRPGYYDGISLEEAATLATIGTGPWKFVEWEPGQFIRFERNEDYWDGPPEVAELIYRFVPEASTRAAELISANVDLVYPVDADTMTALAGQEGISVQSTPGNSMTMLQVSVQEGRQFADLDLRLGLNAAIDRQLVVDNLFRGLAVVENQMSPTPAEVDSDPLTGYNQDWEGYQYDPELAAELLAPVTDPVLLYSATNNLLQAEVVAEQLRQVGLDVEVIPVDPAAMSTAIDSGEYDIWIQSYGGLDNFGNNWNTHFSCATNDAGIVRTGYCNADQDARMEAALDLDEDGKAAVYQEVGQELNENPPWVPLWSLNEIAAYRDYVSGYVISGNGQMNLWRITLSK